MSGFHVQLDTLYNLAKCAYIIIYSSPMYNNNNNNNNLCLEICRISNMKCINIRVISGAAGNGNKTFGSRTKKTVK